MNSLDEATKEMDLLAQEVFIPRSNGAVEDARCSYYRMSAR